MKRPQMFFSPPPHSCLRKCDSEKNAAASCFRTALVAKMNEFALVFYLPAEVQSCGKTCEADGNHQWLGVSLARQPGDHGGHVLVTNTLVFLSGNIRLHVLFFLFLVGVRCNFNASGTSGRRKCCESIFFRFKIPLFYYYVTVLLKSSQFSGLSWSELQENFYPI